MKPSAFSSARSLLFCLLAAATFVSGDLTGLAENESSGGASLAQPPANPVPARAMTGSEPVQLPPADAEIVIEPTIRESPSRSALAVRPPAPKPDLEEARRKLRMHRAEVIKGLGCDVDWTKHTSSELLDMELRIRKAQELRKLGCSAMWEVESLSELSDKKARLEKARSLERKGVLVNWTRTSLAAMIDLENRIRKAQQLGELGRVVDWQKHSLRELSDMESVMLRRLLRR